MGVGGWRRRRLQPIFLRTRTLERWSITVDEIEIDDLLDDLDPSTCSCLRYVALGSSLFVYHIITGRQLEDEHKSCTVRVGISVITEGARPKHDNNQSYSYICSLGGT